VSLCLDFLRRIIPGADRSAGAILTSLETLYHIYKYVITQKGTSQLQGHGITYSKHIVDVGDRIFEATKLSAVEHDAMGILASDYIALFSSPSPNITRKIHGHFLVLRLITGYNDLSFCLYIQGDTS
jgi:hypothetical protein